MSLCGFVVLARSGFFGFALGWNFILIGFSTLSSLLWLLHDDFSVVDDLQSLRFGVVVHGKLETYTSSDLFFL